MIIKDSYTESDQNYRRGYALEEYDGRISIVAVEVGKDGKTYMKWCFPQVFKDGERRPSEKGVPWKIELGDRRAAIERLEVLLVLLRGESGSSESYGPVGQDDMPF